MNESLRFIVISLVASILQLDVRVFGQFMVSQPIVVGPVIGYLIGQPLLGLNIGVVIELLYISVLPVGLKIPPNATAATTFAVISSSITDAYGIGLFLSIFFATKVGFLYKFLDISMRTLNSAFLGWVDTSKQDHVEKRITLLTFYGVILTFLSSILFYLIFLPVMVIVVKKIYGFITPYVNSVNLKFLIYVLPAIGVGLSLSHFIEE